MHLLDANGAWVEGLLDQTVLAGTSRVHVQRQWALSSASSQYFVRPRDPRMVVAYLRAFGPRRVWRKIRSRQQETTRNDAWLSVGLGWVDGDRTKPVVFVATSAPRGVERWVLSDLLVRSVHDLPGGAEVEAALKGPPRHAVAVDREQAARALGADAHAQLIDLAGWQPEEGTEPEIADATWSAIAALTTTTVGKTASITGSWSDAPPRPPVSEVCERAERTVASLGAATGASASRTSASGPDTSATDTSATDTSATGPSATDTSAPATPPYHVFGYGQYAKVNAIANLDKRLHLAGVHEINPVQLGPVTAASGPTLDTSPLPRPGEQIVNAVVAGYHHTHVPTAIALMEQGARHVIIEKPIASSPDQVEALLAAMERHPGTRVHCAFQRSHSPFNAMLRKDLGAGPVSMAATVYEVPLPERHWYRWPVVGNAVVSNGCHWIDYFLHVNDRPTVVDLGAVALTDQTLLTIELSTGASASISLRHAGSPRLGVRDLIQFWTTDGTATIEDNASYRAERGYGSVRRRSVHRSRATELMYEEFGRRIALDLPGDDPAAIGRSARAVVQLAALVDEARSARPPLPAQ